MVVHKCKHKHPYKKEEERDHRQKGRRQCDHRVKVGVIQLEAKEHQRHQHNKRQGMNPS